MNTSHLTRRTAATLLAAFATAAVAAPAQAAGAPTRPDDRALHGLPAIAYASPYDRGFGGIDELPSAPSAHPDDRAERISPTAVPAPPAGADGFDWTDAGVGAAGASALLLVAVGFSAAGFRSRRATALPS